MGHENKMTKSKCFKTRIKKGKKIGKEGGENTKTGREKKRSKKEKGNWRWQMIAQNIELK